MKYGDRVEVGYTIAVVDGCRPVLGNWRQAVLVRPTRSPPIEHRVVRYDDGTQYAVPQTHIRPAR